MEIFWEGASQEGFQKQMIYLLNRVHLGGRALISIFIIEVGRVLVGGFLLLSAGRSWGKIPNFILGKMGKEAAAAGKILHCKRAISQGRGAFLLE